MDRTGLHPGDELPLHPTVVRAARRYAEAVEDARDAIVAEILRDWNTELLLRPRRGARPASGSETILIVDDDPRMRRMLAEILALEGYRVVQAQNGAEALEILQWCQPGVIVLDLLMPTLDGWGFRACQQTQASLADIPVLVLTALSSEEAGELGAAAFLRKPVRLETLLKTIGELIGSSAERFGSSSPANAH
jgi:two-component system response regulator MprA